MKRACLLCLAALSFSCDSISKAADDIATIELGADSLSAVQLERSVTLGAGQLPVCLDVSLTLPSSNTSVTLMNSAGGCSLMVQVPDLTLLDKEAIQKARKESGPFDVDGVRGGSIEVQQVQLTTAEGAGLDLASYVDALSVQVDGEVLLDRITPAALLGEPDLTRDLPDSVIDKLKSALKTDQVATADVVLTLWLSGSRLPELPDTLKMLLVLQPHLEVNVVDAAF